VGHAAAAVDGQPTAGRPPSSAAAMGQSLSAASADDRRTSRSDRHSGFSRGRFGGEPPCK
jgi:hypothetical protein